MTLTCQRVFPTSSAEFDVGGRARAYSKTLTYDAGPTRDLAGEETTLCVVSGPASRVKHDPDTESICDVKLILKPCLHKYITRIMLF